MWAAAWRSAAGLALLGRTCHRDSVIPFHMQECDKIKRHVSSLAFVLKCSLTGWANEDNRSAPIDASILSSLRIALGPGEIWAVHDAAADRSAHTQICRRWFWPRESISYEQAQPLEEDLYQFPFAGYKTLSG